MTATDCAPLIDGATSSFIVKVWLEETLAESDQKVWRGHVTHVPSGERRYFQSLDGLLSFIEAYIQGLDERQQS